ncbi:MAG: hypothetical protein ABI968_00010 [Acidobacteriota bacterium]
MLLRRRLVSSVSAAAALLPPLIWLAPALFFRKAPSFRDQGDFFYPLKLYTADRLRAGGIPLWNPLSGTGEPWLANGQSGVFYPPSLLFLIRSPALAAALFLLLHFAIAVWGARRLLKEEAVSDAGALFGAAAFAASGYAASLSVYWNHFGAFAYLPGIVSLARSGLRTRAAMLGLAALVGLQAMAGSPELSAATIGLALVLAVFPRPEFPEPAVPLSRGATLRRLAGGVALGLALAGWVLLPMGELLARSDRRHPLPAASRDLGDVGAAAAVSAAGLAPEGGAGTYLASLYIGPLILVAAAAAFGEEHRRRLARILVLCALAGILLAMHGPPGSWLRSLPPLDRVRYPAKWLAWTSLAVATLAGLGIDSLRFTVAAGRRRLVFAVLALCGVAVCALSPQPWEVRLASAGGCAALGLMALFANGRPPLGALLSGAAAACLIVTLAQASASLPRFAPESEIRSCPEDVRTLSRVAGRVVTPPMSLLWGWVLHDDRFDAGVLRRQRESLLGYTNLTCGVAALRTAAPLKTAGIAAIEQSIAEDTLPAGAASARALWTPFQPARLPSRKMGEFFRAPLAPYRPRLSFLRGYRIEPDAERAWERVAAGQVDLTSEVLLDRRPVPDPEASPAHPLLIARLAEDLPERVVAEVTTSHPGLLVLTDLHYPGWIAEEGGRLLPLMRADGYFRAVALTEGSHRVVFRYRPMSFYAGCVVSGLALLTMLGLWFQGEPVRRRAR